MSGEGDSGDVSLDPEGKVIPPTVKDPTELKVSSFTIPVDGSGDNIPPQISPENDPKQDNNSCEIPKDNQERLNIDSETDKQSIEQIDGVETVLDSHVERSKVESILLDPGPSTNTDVTVAPNPTFLSLTEAEEADSETPEEDLVLRWEDDEDDIAQASENIKETVETPSADDDNFWNSVIDPTNSIGNDINALAVIEEQPKIAEKEIVKELESGEAKSSEYDTDDQDELLSEIDAQIAELGASLSKAEKEKLPDIKTAESKSVDEVYESVASSEKETKQTDILGNIKNNSLSKTAGSEKQLEKDDKISEMETDKHLLEDETSLKLPLNQEDQDNKNQKVHTELDTVDSLDNIENNETVSKDLIEAKIANIETMEIDVSDDNLTFDENNIVKNPKMASNSTLLDDSLGLSETSHSNDSFANFISNADLDKPHKVNQPNVMLDIPTQELIDLEDSVLSHDTSSELKQTDKTKPVDSTDEKDIVKELKDSFESVGEIGIHSITEKTNETTNKIDQPADNKKSVTSELEQETQSMKESDDNKLESNVGQSELCQLKAIVDFAPITEKGQSSDEDMKTDEDLEKQLLEAAKSDERRISKEFHHHQEPSDSIDISSKAVETTDVQPTTSLLEGADDAAEAAEATDSLGLLAECSRMRDDDDVDNEDQETSDHDDYDDDMDPDDESSNHQTADHSEDSCQDGPKQDTDTNEKAFSILDSISKEMESKENYQKADDETEIANLDGEKEAVHEEIDIREDSELDNIETDAVEDIFNADAATTDINEADDTNEIDATEETNDIDATEETNDIEAADDTNEIDPTEDTTEIDVEENTLGTDVVEDIIETDAAEINDIETDTAQVDAIEASAITDVKTDVVQADVIEKEPVAEGNKEKEVKDAEKQVGDIEDGGDKESGEQIEENKEIVNISDVSDMAKDGENDQMENDDDVVCEGVQMQTDKVEPKRALAKINQALQKETIVPKNASGGKLRRLLQGDARTAKNLDTTQSRHVVNIVDLEASSSDDEAIEIDGEKKKKELTSVNLPKEIEVMSSGDKISEIITKEGEIVINVPKVTPLHKVACLNTSELTIKTATSPSESTLVIPETKIGDRKESGGSKFGALEVFNLDSDEEEEPPKPAETPPPPADQPPDKNKKCVNPSCASGLPPHRPAPPAAAARFEWRNKRRATICDACLYEHVTRAEKLVEGIKDLTPLLSLEEIRDTQELVEISDSDDEEDAEKDEQTAETMGEVTANLLERQLADMINATWDKFKMESRLKEAEDELMSDLRHLEKESAEVNAMLDTCQQATDRLRAQLYAAFEVERHQLPAIQIVDTPDKFIYAPELPSAQQYENKRRLSSPSESQAKKPALQPPAPGPSAPAPPPPPPPAHTDDQGDPGKAAPGVDAKIDDDKDVSVVKLSVENAPSDLPPPGEIPRPVLLPGHVTYAMRHSFGSWIRARVLEVSPKGTQSNVGNFTMCRVKFENKISSRNAYKLLPARCLAYFEPSTVRMTIGTRVIALFKDTSGDKGGKRDAFYSGVVAEVPNPVNRYRYLVFFDDGYAQYVSHADTRLVCESSSLVWEEVHPFSREFVREYLLAYPERPMVRLHTGQSIKTEWNGKWLFSRVTAVDASLVQVYFDTDKRSEWIYRGSTRLAPLYLELQAAGKHRNRPLPRNRQNKLNMPYVEYTRMEDAPDPAHSRAQEELRRQQRAVAKKSTTPAHAPPPAAGNLDAVTSRVVYYTPKNAVKPYKLTPHACGVQCKRTDVLALKDLRTYNPLAKPLLSGWERQIVRYKGHKEVMYRAPCGRRLRSIHELHRYLRTVNSDMGVDLFDFHPNTHCLAEFVLNKCIVGKKDLSHGKENVPVPCVNYYDESLPEFCSYNTERTPTAGVPLNLDPDFLCGCDCTDDCQDKSKCACWRMTLEGARTIGLDGDVGYVYKRLPEPLPSGIYECNARCKCKQTCLNRVAQHPLQLKLQVFKTVNRGWGIRALNDVPKGSFLCIYAGNLLTDATANLDGLNEGDEYLAELDYIEVVEQMKEGFEEDIPEADKKLDKKENNEDEESEESESEEEAKQSKSDEEDGDFEPGFIPRVITEFSKRLRKRDKKKAKEDAAKEKEKDKERVETRDGDEECITISDDEELREPARFTAQPGMGQCEPRHRSVRTLFGSDEACYIMDAKVQGNIGRYLNHSCSPNVFVQNVFVDTHDPRFPWVAFFALAHIRAGTELTWNYNYDVGSVPGKALYCYCGAPNCRGRLL